MLAGMRTLLVLLVIAISGALPAQTDRGAFRQPVPETGRPELRWLDEALYDSGFLFTDKVRQAYFDLCLEQVAPDLHFSEETWEWLLDHPAVFNAAFAFSYPPNPNIIHNFVKLAKLVGPVYAEKYQQLLIAFAVANRDRRLLESVRGEGRYGSLIGRNLTYNPGFKAELEKGVVQQNGWYINHDVAVPAESAFASDMNGVIFPDEAERRTRLQRLHANFDLGGDADAKAVANWLKANRSTKIYEIMSLDWDRFYQKTGIKLREKREPKSLPWDKIAHVAGRYPPRTFATVAETLCLRIQRYEQKGAERSKLFPLSKAPWPLLLLLTQNDPVDESTFFWNMYMRTGGVPGYATYSFDYTKPEIRYNDGVWHPDAAPRILTDGGVCGRLSTMAEFAQRSIGTPAQGMGQPGHRAFMTYEYGNGRYSAAMHHSVNTIDVSTVQWWLTPVWGPTFDQKTKLNDFGELNGANSTNYERDNIRWHIGLCEAMNRGLSSWEDTRMALIIYDFYPGASNEQKEALLRSAFLLNVANTDVVFRLAKLRKGNARQTEKLRDAFRRGFVDTAAGCTGDEPIKADQDLSRLLRSNTVGPRNPKKVTNEWALFVLNGIFVGTYTNIPDEFSEYYQKNRLQWIADKNAYAKVVAEELKYQKRLGNSPFLAEVQRLNDKYDRVRLGAEIDRTRTVKEERERRKAQENAW